MFHSLWLMYWFWWNFLIDTQYNRYFEPSVPIPDKKKTKPIGREERVSAENGKGVGGREGWQHTMDTFWLPMLIKYLMVGTLPTVDVGQHIGNWMEMLKFRNSQKKPKKQNVKRHQKHWSSSTCLASVQ